MNINPVNIDKTVEYQNNLQARFKDVISSKDEHSSMFSGALGDGPAVKVDISGVGMRCRNITDICLKVRL